MSNSYRNDVVGWVPWTSEPADANGMTALVNPISANPEPGLEAELRVESCGEMDLHGYQVQFTNWKSDAFTNTGLHLNALIAGPDHPSADGRSTHQQGLLPNPNIGSMCSNNYLAPISWDMKSSADAVQIQLPLPDRHPLAKPSTLWDISVSLPFGSSNSYSNPQSFHHAHQVHSTTPYPFSGSQPPAWGHVATNVSMNTAFHPMPTHTAPIAYAVATISTHTGDPKSTDSIGMNHGSTTIFMPTESEEADSELVCFGMVGAWQ